MMSWDEKKTRLYRIVDMLRKLRILSYEGWVHTDEEGYADIWGIR